MRCTCPKPLRRWTVFRRNYSCSAFNGYRREWSAYSDVECKTCERMWRTKAAYVDGLPDSSK